MLEWQASAAASLEQFLGIFDYSTCNMYIGLVLRPAYVYCTWATRWNARREILQSLPCIRTLRYLNELRERGERENELTLRVIYEPQFVLYSCLKIDEVIKYRQFI
jgi:hypothetical protein